MNNFPFDKLFPRLPELDLTSSIWSEPISMTCSVLKPAEVTTTEYQTSVRLVLLDEDGAVAYTARATGKVAGRMSKLTEGSRCKIEAHKQADGTISVIAVTFPLTIGGTGNV